MKTITVVLLFFMLCSSSMVVFALPAEPSYTEYRNLRYHGLNDLFSSLTVSGSVVLYDDYDLKPTANIKMFADESVPNLAAYHRGTYGNWDNRVRSLKVAGNVTLYEHPNCLGRKASFTSDNLSYDDLGTEWNKNPTLVRDEDAWDCRTWHWTVGVGDLLDIFHGNEENYVNWNSDGLVDSRARDGSGDPWKAANFDQGCERYEDEISNLDDLGWGGRANSLRVDGQVTLFEEVGYEGTNASFAWDTSLIPYGWANKAHSLKLTKGSRVTLYEKGDYLEGGPSKSFVCPSYQPLDLTVGDQETITLEGVVQNWQYLSWGGSGLASWTGAKFDVFVVEDRFNRSSNVLMLEFYFIRNGGNLFWYPWEPHTGDRVFRHDTPNSYNYLVALDCFPQRVDRTVYSGDAARWRVDVKSFIQDACNQYPALDINKLKIAKMSFTLESAWNGLTVNPWVECCLSRLRLCYTTTPTNRAAFTYKPEASTENPTIIFDASASYLNGDLISNYIWDFGDGYTATADHPVISHSYAVGGVYNVTLTVQVSSLQECSTWQLVEIGTHDIAVVDIAPSQDWAYQGWTVNINTTISNTGDFSETAVVTLYYNLESSGFIGSVMVDLLPGEANIVTFAWNTSDVPACQNYLVTAVAGVPVDNNMSDNILAGTTKIEIRIPGDVNNDERVDMRDVSGVARSAFGTTPSHPRWNPAVDVNQDCKVDLRDIALVSKNFGKYGAASRSIDFLQCTGVGTQEITR